MDDPVEDEYILRRRPPPWYKQFEKLIQCNHEAAAQCWAKDFSEERRVEVVWIATKWIHLSVLKWTLLLENDSTGQRWIDPNQLEDENGCRLLHEIGSNVNATVHKMLAAFQLLIRDVGCRVDDEDHDGRTALHCVCGSHVKRSRRGRKRYVNLLRLLVEAGADVNRQFHGITPLHLLHESPWAMRYLLMETDARADVEDTFLRTPLMWSLRNPHMPAVSRIPVFIFRNRMNFLASDYMGHSLIHYAVLRAQSDKLDETKKLLNRLYNAGADANHQNRRLRTPLFFLIPKPDMMELVEFMIRHPTFPSDVNLCDADGFTVVHVAAILGKLDYVTLLLPYMNSNVKTVNGETVRSCLEQYCDPSAVTEEVETLLAAMERRGQSMSMRTYAEPYTVWEYVHLLDRFRDLFSLYIVDTFYRYRGGRSMFSDFFHHISHSAIVKQRAKNFVKDIEKWNGSSRMLLDVIDRHSVVIPYMDRKQRKESSQIFFHVRNMVEHLMREVLLKDAQEPEESRFGWALDVLPVGSAVDGTKILLPDEFDFLVVFRRFQPGEKLRVGDDNVSQVEKFRLHLIRCMQEMDSQLLGQDQPPVLGFQFVDCELRRICLNIRLTWWGQGPSSEFHGMAISIDLTPVFHFDGWTNQSGFRPLRSLPLLPDWFSGYQVVEHFRPLHNIVTVPPCAATMEVRCLVHPANRLFQYCLRLLKLIVQSDYIIKDAPAPNSHFLKVALLNYIQELGPPTRRHDIALYVNGICRRFLDTSWRWSIPYFVSDAQLPSPSVSIREELFSILDRAYCSCFFHDCSCFFHDCTFL